MKAKIFVILFLILGALFSLRVPAYAQGIDETETFEAKVVGIAEEKELFTAGERSQYQRLILEISEGEQKGKTIEVENGLFPMANQPIYGKGDKVIVSLAEGPEGGRIYQIVDSVRRDALLILFLIFVGLAVLVARWRGVASLLGMGLSFLVIFSFVLPQISRGADPVIIAVAGAMLIIPITFYLSHGINRKTTGAIIGTIVALLITGLLANIFVEAARLTGFASEEAGFIQFSQQGTINIKGLLLAGIIIGVLGILDDISIAQSAIVFQLKEANPKMGRGELFGRAMDVGKDHIASMVNTLILVYTGAALPLLLLFIGNPRPFRELVNYEIIADEIVRTLVASIGLILAVPITTAVATFLFSSKGSK